MRAMPGSGREIDRAPQSCSRFPHLRPMLRPRCPTCLRTPVQKHSSHRPGRTFLACGSPWALQILLHLLQMAAWCHGRMLAIIAAYKSLQAHLEAIRTDNSAFYLSSISSMLIS